MSEYHTIGIDLVRVIGGVNNNGIKLSRADASQIINTIVDANGLDKEKFLKNLYKYYQDNIDSILNDHMHKLENTQNKEEE